MPNTTNGVEYQRTNELLVHQACLHTLDGKIIRPSILNRFMCVVGMPWFDQGRNRVQRGVNCFACRVLFHPKADQWTSQQLEDARKQERVLYSEEGFFHHLVHCDEALQLFADNIHETCAERLCSQVMSHWRPVCEITRDPSSLGLFRFEYVLVSIPIILSAAIQASGRY